MCRVCRVVHRATATVSRPAAPETDSAATVPAEAMAMAELVSAVTESLALCSVKESLLLQRFAVNLINANKAAYKIPVLLIRESAIACRPDKLTGRLWMIGIIHEIVIPGIRR